ncbi:hypothetical protein C440_05737 [Haloferax mucosum ATCC BAA-1512]|uniref:Uncharacterized protein n=1 Tax=Haloferax mucosum ATCC BAA-1512 TaxID=662479 RepID=M0IJ70_9EURY|nr:hypothetical protein [Haloferax mucosum]ELZ96067.1 hypothetical protein C440_05737 [Haloferax mucosum ATCC BAA-1512]
MSFDPQSILQILGVIFSGLTPLMFALPRLPYLKCVARPAEFEDGWFSLLVRRQLNHEDDGFDAVVEFASNHPIGDDSFVESISDHPAVDSQKLESEGVASVIEEIRILTKPRNFSEWILLCFDEDSDGPQGEPKKTENLGFVKFNTDSRGSDWQWFAPVSAIEHTAQAFIQNHVSRWMTYGAIALFLSVAFQLAALAL